MGPLIKTARDFLTEVSDCPECGTALSVGYEGEVGAGVFAICDCKNPHCKKQFRFDLQIRELTGE
jgi:hypothetical protein